MNFVVFSCATLLKTAHHKECDDFFHRHFLIATLAAITSFPFSFKHCREACRRRQSLQTQRPPIFREACHYCRILKVIVDIFVFAGKIFILP